MSPWLASLPSLAPVCIVKAMAGAFSFLEHACKGTRTMHTLETRRFFTPSGIELQPLQSSAKDQAAYKRAMDALEESYQQGWRDEPLSGDPLLFSDVSDKHIADGSGRVNAFRGKYERGLLKLRYYVYPDELEVSND